MVVEESGEACTINLCKLCYNEKLVQQGKQPLNLWEWRIGESGSWERTVSARNVGVFHPREGRSKTNFSGRCSRKIKKESKVSGKKSLPFKEVLEQVKRSADTDCGPQTKRRAYSAKAIGRF